MSHLVISVADGLSPHEMGRALEFAPVHAKPDDRYPLLFRAAGFHDIDLVDVTEEYLATLEASIREYAAESIEVEQLIGSDEFAERTLRRQRSAQAVREGLVKRYLISAVRP